MKLDRKVLRSRLLLLYLPLANIRNNKTSQIEIKKVELKNIKLSKNNLSYSNKNYMKNKETIITILLPILLTLIPIIYDYVSKDSKQISFKIENVNLITVEKNNGVKIFKRNNSNHFAQRITFINSGNKTIDNLKLDANFDNTIGDFRIEDFYIEKTPQDNFNKFGVLKSSYKFIIFDFKNINPKEKFEILIFSNKFNNLNVNFDSKDINVNQLSFIKHELPRYIIYLITFLATLIILLMTWFIRDNFTNYKMNKSYRNQIEVLKRMSQK